MFTLISIKERKKNVHPHFRQTWPYFRKYYGPLIRSYILQIRYLLRVKEADDFSESQLT